MNLSFKKVLIAASIGAVATLSLYLADLRKDEPNNIELALRGGTPSDAARPPVSKTPKDAQLSDVPAESFTEGDGEQLAVDIRDGLAALKARMESSEEARRRDMQIASAEAPQRRHCGGQCSQPRDSSCHRW